MNTNRASHQATSSFDATRNETNRSAGAWPFALGCALLGTIGVFLHEAKADPLTATWFRCAFGLLGLTVWIVLRGHTRALRLTRTTGAWPFALGCALLGTIGVFLHEAKADPLTATWFRCAFGLLGLTVWVVLRGHTRALRLTRTTGPWIITAASLMVLSWGLFFGAVERTSAGVAIVLFHVQPMWVLMLASLWLKESIGRQRVASVAVAMIGLVLATGIVEHSANGTLQPGYWSGVAACIAGSFCMACVTLIAKRLRAMPPGILAWWQCAIGTLVLWVWPMQHGWPAWDMSWAWLAGLGLIHTGLAYTLMYIGMARLDTGRIAVLQFVYPAVAIVIDWLCFDQRLSGVQLAGIALMSVAIWFAERERRS